MLQYQFRPLTSWPGTKKEFRVASKFSASFTATLDLLERELKHLGAKNVVLQADVDANDIRNDGMLKQNAKLRSPAIILSFDSKYGSLSYPCDQYSSWQENLRAIALSLEALRSVDRYGVTRRAEQYRGWERLPGPTTSATFNSLDDAADWLVRTGGGDRSKIVRYRIEMEAAYRRACLATHPDHHPECVEDFKKVQAAKEMLEKHFGSAA